MIPYKEIPPFRTQAIMKLFPSARAPRVVAALFLSFGLTLSQAGAELKVAVVDMTVLLTNYHKTKTAEEQDLVNRTEIKKDDAEKMAAIRSLVQELQKLEADMRDPSQSADKRSSIARAGQEKQETLKQLQEDREQFLDRNSRLLSQNMVTVMNEIRTEVMAEVEKQSAASEADLVFDESGLTTSQVPFLLFARKRIDITADVLKALNKDAPSDAAESPKKTISGDK